MIKCTMFKKRGRQDAPRLPVIGMDDDLWDRVHGLGSEIRKRVKGSSY